MCQQTELMQPLTSIFKTLIALWLLQGWAAENNPLAEPLSDKTQSAMPANPPASWLTYYLAHSGETAPGDLNGAFFWKGGITSTTFTRIGSASLGRMSPART